MLERDSRQRGAEKRKLHTRPGAVTRAGRAESLSSLVRYGERRRPDVHVGECVVVEGEKGMADHAAQKIVMLPAIVCALVGV